MTQQYKSEFPSKKWTFYALIGDIGWIFYLVAMFVYGILAMGQGVNKAVVLFYWLSVLCGVFIVIGVIGLIVEAIQKLGRDLTKKQLHFGLGCVVCGSLAGGICSCMAVLLAIALKQYVAVGWLIVMLTGASLTFGFELPMLMSYKKQG